MFSSPRPLALFLFVIFVAWPRAAEARPLRQINALPDNCATLLDGWTAAGLQDWRSLVHVEHCDRIKRLRRISARLPLDQRPIFFDGTVLADRLSSEVGIDLPILRVVFPERVFFDTDSAALTPAAAEIVGIIAESLRHEPPDATMFVAGHADARASRAYNARLSVERAHALAAAVLARGTNLATVWRVGFGEDLPLIAGDSDYVYGQNRRIEFLFAARAEALAAWLADQQLDLLCQGQSRAETADCLRRLDLDEPYDIVQLRPRDRTAIGGAPAQRRRAGSRRGEGRTADPTESDTDSIAPNASSGRRIDPTPAPTIRLNLQRRSAGRIY